MKDRFETTFTVEMSATDAWQVIASGERADGWWLPGFDTTAEVIAVDEGKAVHARKVDEPCAGTEIMVTVEAAGSGAKVTVVQAGFDPGFLAAALDAVSIGWSHIAADFALYVERGIVGGRHQRPWALFGCGLEDTPAGLAVGDVWGGYAQQAGLAPGDIVLTVGGAPVVDRRELETTMRVFTVGDEVTATWAHGRDLVTATAPL